MSYYVLALIILTGILMLLGIIWFIAYTLYVLHNLRKITGSWNDFDYSIIERLSLTTEDNYNQIIKLKYTDISNIWTRFGLLQDYLKIEYKEYPKNAKFVKKVK